MMSKWAKEFEKSGAVSIGVDPGASDETLVYIFFLLRKKRMKLIFSLIVILAKIILCMPR